MIHARSGRVLIVDDAPPVRLLLRSYLVKLGFRESEISVAENGAAGLEAFGQRTPDLVFMDVEMPVMGGEETATRMLAERPEMKIVVMTAVDETDARVKHLRSWGAFAVLPKPVRLDKLRSIVDLIEAEHSMIERIR